MAITGSYSTNTGVDFNLIAYYSYTQDTTANTSTVTVTLKLAHNAINASALSGSYLSVAGNKVAYSKYIYQSGYGVNETTLATKTVKITHSSDGKGSCTIKAAFVFNGVYSGKSIGTLTLNKTLTLKNIPRASALSIPSSMNTGSSLTVTITPSSTSFKHKVRFIVDDTIKYTSGFIATGTKTFNYTIPHSWSPNKASKTMTVNLYTYTSDGNLVATKTKTMTINVPSSIVPNISSVTPSASSALSGNYVQGKSKIKLTTNASAGSGSSISRYYYKGVNIDGNDTTYSTTSATKTSSVIQSSGNLTYQVRVMDARGRYSEWYSVKIYVNPYSVPKIASIKAQRCLKDGTIDNNGTYAKVTVKTTHASINGANTATVNLTNSKDGATTTRVISSTSASNTYSGVYGSAFAIDSSYTVSATITDEYGATHTLSATLAAVQRTLNIAKYGNGIAIGKLSMVTKQTETPRFECNWDATFSDDVRIKNASAKCFEVTRTGMSDDIDDDGANETADIQAQLYVNDSGNITCRRRYSVDNGGTYNTQGYWQLRDSDMHIENPLTVSGTITAKGFRVPEIQHGNVSITPSAANTPTSKVVTFAKKFSGNPDIIANGHTSVPGSTLLGVGTASRSTTSCAIWITRTNTTDTTVNWVAVY